MVVEWILNVPVILNTNVRDSILVTVDEWPNCECPHLRLQEFATPADAYFRTE